MATTTNYGWDTPDDTDLVKDGAAAIRTLGSSIDTTTKNLNPETTLGDLAYRSATANVKTRLALGTAGQVLRVNSGGNAPEWATTADQTPLTTKGDLFTFSTVDARLGVGANGTLLTADSSEATGLKWAAPAAGGGMTLINSGGTALSGNITTISSIPTTYNDLIIYIVDYYAGNDTNLHLRINSDSTAANYQQFVNRGTASSDGTYVTAGDAGVDVNGYSIDNVSNDNFTSVYIPNYANTVSKKVINAMSGFVQTTGAKAVCNNTTYYSGSTLAITELAFRASDGSNWSAGTVYVYGVK